ncbi:uncharacterized protein [Elaeis guineensis]|uniref:Uncharacterized protein LOC109506106 n=1 Tax=Elaeis guineensis var. tenera TaxID=51953 RepID=A0A6J0PLX0_ELAGV|nr:uncharacterized protein LOC109506106 [Elaeis guineensis]
MRISSGKRPNSFPDIKCGSLLCSLLYGDGIQVSEYKAAAVSFQKGQMEAGIIEYSYQHPFSFWQDPRELDMLGQRTQKTARAFKEWANQPSIAFLLKRSFFFSIYMERRGTEIKGT